MWVKVMFHQLVGRGRQTAVLKKWTPKMLPEHLFISFLIQSIKLHQKKDDSIVIVQHIQNKVHLFD